MPLTAIVRFPYFPNRALEKLTGPQRAEFLASLPGPLAVVEVKAQVDLQNWAAAGGYVPTDFVDGDQVDPQLVAADVEARLGQLIREGVTLNEELIAEEVRAVIRGRIAHRELLDRLLALEAAAITPLQLIRHPGTADASAADNTVPPSEELRKLGVLRVYAPAATLSAAEDLAEQMRDAGRKEWEAKLAARAAMQRELVARVAPAALARYDRGLLPEHELRDLARAEVYVRFASFARFVKLTRADLPEREGCDHEEVEASAEPVQALSANAFETLQLLEEVAQVDGGTFTVTPREHRISCCDCGVEMVKRHSALVSVCWAGLDLSREYLLA